MAKKPAKKKRRGMPLRHHGWPCWCRIGKDGRPIPGSPCGAALAPEGEKA
jgi:hypothetical protein